MPTPRPAPRSPLWERQIARTRLALAEVSREVAARDAIVAVRAPARASLERVGPIAVHVVVSPQHAPMVPAGAARGQFE